VNKTAQGAGTGTGTPAQVLPSAIVHRTPNPSQPTHASPSARGELPLHMRSLSYRRMRKPVNGFHENKAQKAKIGTILVKIF
jgi:hypothetical protein